ncbi:NADase-type glycan-binding domain-containing protein [Leptospira interrogans]|uniref:NAD glycohydrolase translocation F5/8 type C domain-containing protein n=3 Tax=Leptospira interrogans TaxID=173 RepID=A0AAQ0B085_LEPIR|nr:hypothetical protein [Leptospira interrogans]EMM84155.1 hypothetical protein LEP1GSC037_0292 [Leptospira interrogans str. 2006001854]QOI44931.1 hypothetical protein Lepto782_22205 [Leptospira interrogans serovar Canicola]QOI53269.1 hypothetical protein Lepto1489_23305 [Leptospira interrogans serovar Bataviae]
MKKIIITGLMLFISLYLNADSTTYRFLSINKIKASSSSILIEKSKPKDFYDPIKAMDGKVETAWCEGTEGTGANEYIEFMLPPTNVIGLNVLNGFGKYKDKYLSNNRVKEAKVSILAENGTKKEFTYAFADNACGSENAGGKIETAQDYCYEFLENKSKYKACISDFQNQCIMSDYDGGGERIFFDDRLKIVYFKFEILSTYAGSKYNDTCIAEISFLEVNSGDYSPDYFKTDQSIKKRY